MDNKAKQAGQLFEAAILLIEARTVMEEIAQEDSTLLPPMALSGLSTLIRELRSKARRLLADEKGPTP